MLIKKYYRNGRTAFHLVGTLLTYFYKNGRVQAIGSFYNGQLEGEWRFFRENGQLWQIGHFLNDAKHGKWIRFDRNGQIVAKEMFYCDQIIKTEI